MRNYFLFFCCGLFIFATQHTSAQFAGGSGSVVDPWKISTIEQLNKVRNYPDSNFILLNDLDFSGTTYDSSSSTEGWEPIGNNNAYSNRFKGTFNGKGNTISNLYINRTSLEYVGLFGFVDGATIDSVNISNGSITGGNSVGALAGIVMHSEISNCSASASIKGKQTVGGLIGSGHKEAIISNCNANATVNGEIMVGGIFGHLYKPTLITDCSSSGPVSGDERIGGFSGSSDSARVENSFSTSYVNGNYRIGGFIGWSYTYSKLNNCYATGIVSGDTNVGGFVGTAENQVKIENCYTSGNINGSSLVGGLAGELSSSTVENSNASGKITGIDYIGGFIGNAYKSTISTCYSTDSVKGSTNVGGFIGRGYLNTEIYNCYSEGHVIATDIQSGGFAGIIGENSLLKNCYAIGNTTGTNGSSAFTGDLLYSTLDSCYATGTLYADTIIGGLVGFCLHGTIKNSNMLGHIYGDDNIGGIIGASDSAIVTNCNTLGNVIGTWENVGGLIGVMLNSSEIDSSYSIGEVTGYSHIGGLVGAVYNLCSISNSHSSGIISGNYSTGGLIGNTDTSVVYNCYATGNVKGINASTGGLIGETTSHSKIIKCYSTSTVYGNESVGGLIGATYGSTRISKSSASGDIKGVNNTGGLIGYLNNSNVSQSFATGNVKGKLNVGGLAGSIQTNASITNCYASGDITGQESAGGLIGITFSSSVISECYAIGKVSGDLYLGGFLGNDNSSIITNCFYNITTSGQSSGIGQNNNNVTLSGYSTNQMKKAGTFTDFNFDTIWAIRTDSTYPALQKLNNAPFAFSDTVDGRIDDVLTSNLDYETLKINLTYQYDSIISLQSNTNYSYKNGNYSTGDSLMVSYRIGELINDFSDTLWGNRITSFVIYANHAPVITSIAPDSATIGVEYIYTIIANDEDDDALSYSLENAPEGMTVSDSGVIIWTPDENSTMPVTVTLTVSDGELNDSEFFTISSYNLTNINLSVSENISIYPNPALSYFQISGFEGSANLCLYNTMGDLLLTKEISSNENINIDNLANGSYIATIYYSGDIITRSVLIIK